MPVPVNVFGKTPPKCKYCLSETTKIAITKDDDFGKSAPCTVCPYCDSPREIMRPPDLPKLVHPSNKSLRCSYCDHAWPARPEFTLCPSCQEPTGASASKPDYTDEEAFHLLKEARFGWWLFHEGCL